MVRHCDVWWCGIPTQKQMVCRHMGHMRTIGVQASMQIDIAKCSKASPICFLSLDMFERCRPSCNWLGLQYLASAQCGICGLAPLQTNKSGFCMWSRLICAMTISTLWRSPRSLIRPDLGSSNPQPPMTQAPVICVSQVRTEALAPALTKIRFHLAPWLRLSRSLCKLKSSRGG